MSWLARTRLEPVAQHSTPALGALNPRDLPVGAPAWAKTFDLPPDVLNFGYYPDVDALLPGDLILTCDMNPHWTSRAIEHFQKLKCSSPRWTHAAMYMGGKGQIVEATFDSFFDRTNGVKIGNLSDYAMTHYIMVRRLPNHFVCSTAPNDAAKCMDARWQLVVSAMKHMNKSYGFFELPRFLKKTYTVLTMYIKPKKLVCSTLYQSAVVDAVGRFLCGDTAVTPGKLAETIELQTVPISWVRVQTVDM